MSETGPLMRVLAFERYAFAEDYAGRDPWQVTMSPATREALYREMFGDTEGEDMRAALSMEIAIDEAMPAGAFRLV